MSNVIDFLEMIGQDARLRHASQNEMKDALTSMQVDPALHAAILAKDRHKLEALIGASNVYCMIIPGTPCCVLMAGREDEGENHRERRA